MKRLARKDDLPNVYDSEIFVDSKGNKGTLYYLCAKPLMEKRKAYLDKFSNIEFYTIYDKEHDRERYCIFVCNHAIK